ncbi:DedA family protein [Anianabacter salinae]|uniref:DedA family protein n=1 Tax=Anianabacter salinae TaxID=2851023 RepID=UPI00225E056B|nr:DedA family protein [Anianabacter salinae]MBV0911603.1 DedA family protein [Anianabacter salinae]
MIETLFLLVADYGVLAIGLAAFLSCLFLPIPTSLLMLTGGAFGASGDLEVAEVAGAAFVGAVLGDQVGFRIGRWGGEAILDRIARNEARARVLARARRVVERRGGVGVFFSTWAVAPLGPWVNLVAGALGMNPLRFTLWDIAGEAIWVTLYVGLGYLFADNIETVAGLMSNLSGALATGVVALLLGLWLRAALRAERKRDKA